MNINYIGQLLTTTSLVFETEYNGKIQCFYVMANDSVKLTEDTLTFKDYIEDKEYTINNSFTFLRVGAKGDVIPSFLESAAYSEYIESNKDQIKSNNSRFLLWFNELKQYFPFVDKDEDNLYALKTQTDTRTLVCMRSFGITDLLGYINKTPSVISQIKINCQEFLLQKAKQAIKELEREKLNLEGELDSIEEIDIIIGMINDTVDEVSFESMENIEDASKLWPPILLPAPFHAKPPEDICIE